MVAAVASGALGVAGCGGSEFEDRTAVVRVGGSSERYEVASCGLDGQTLFVVATSPSGGLLQAAVGLADDDETGVPASTGISVDVDATDEASRVAAFGPEAWARRGEVTDPPGSIGSARLRGSRIQAAGRAVPVDAADQPIDGADPVAVSIDVRCDERDEPGG